MKEGLIKPGEAAKMLGITPTTLAKLRRSKKGPPFVKVSSGAYRYKVEDINQYIEKNREGAQ